MQIRSTEILYKSKSQNLAFRSTYLRSFEGQNSLRKYYFVLGINRALLSIFSCFFTLWKMSFLWTPHSPWKFLPLNPPPPRNFQWPSVGGYGYFLEPHISRRKDLLWLIARLVKGDNQRIPSWTGFNIKFHSHEPVMQDVVGYLPTINAPVTQLSTIS